MKIPPLIITLCFLTTMHAMDSASDKSDKNNITTNATNPARRTELTLSQQVSAMNTISCAWFLIQRELIPYKTSTEELSPQTIASLKKKIEDPVLVITDYATFTSPVELQQYALSSIEKLITQTTRLPIHQQIKDLLFETAYNITSAYLSQEGYVSFDVANQGLAIMAKLVNLNHGLARGFGENFIHLLYEATMKKEETSIIPGQLYLMETVARKISEDINRDQATLDLCEKILILTARYCQHNDPEVVASSLRSIAHFMLILPQASRYASDALHASQNNQYEKVKSDLSVQKMIDLVNRTIITILSLKDSHTPRSSLLERCVIDKRRRQIHVPYMGPSPEKPSFSSSTSPLVRPALKKE